MMRKIVFTVLALGLLVGATVAVSPVLVKTCGAGSYFTAIDSTGLFTCTSLVSANPSATVSGSAVNGSAGTWMTSDSAPALANTAVTPGSYTSTDLTVDAQGRITAASNGTGGTNIKSTPTFFSNTNLGTTGTQFWATGSITSTETSSTYIPMVTAGTVKNLYCAYGGAGALGSGGWVFTLVQNHSATAITCTAVAANNCHDTTHSISVAAGDFLEMQTTANSSPGAGRIPTCSVELD